MRILANENVPGPVIGVLRERGHDVAAVKEIMPGASDHVVLQRAQSEARLIVTLDKDFGELAVRFGLSAKTGVILLRLGGSTPDADNARAVAAITSREDWAGHFAVVTDDRIRVRPLPRRGVTSGVR
jgi:predicted nuclease of predicted toxin-antitoxin system